MKKGKSKHLQFFGFFLALNLLFIVGTSKQTHAQEFSKLKAFEDGPIQYPLPPDLEDPVQEVPPEEEERPVIKTLELLAALLDGLEATGGYLHP